MAKENTPMTFTEAQEILHSMTKGQSLLRHAQSVSTVMRAYARHYKQDAEKWAIAGLLHDADYEAWPEEHPQRIVNLLKEKGQEDIAHAIAAHNTRWGVPYNSLLDKALLACDELTGFVVACTQVRPDGIDSLTPKSVVKKLKQKGFAASVERSEVHAGVEMLETDLNTHIAFIIEALKAEKQALDL